GAGVLADDLLGGEELGGEAEALERDGQGGEVQVLAAVLELAGGDDAQLGGLLQLQAEGRLLGAQRLLLFGAGVGRRRQGGRGQGQGQAGAAAVRGATHDNPVRASRKVGTTALSDIRRRVSLT